jgi:hypothetical protein
MEKLRKETSKLSPDFQADLYLRAIDETNRI